MYRTRKRVVLISINVITIIGFIMACLLLLPQKTDERFSMNTFLVAFIVFFVAVFWGNRFRSYFMAKVRRDSLDDFYVVIGDILEKQGDCSVLLVDRSKNYILYNSPNRTSTSETVRNKL